jgi:membrane protease YdiL (CAAX protease family)
MTPFFAAAWAFGATFLLTLFVSVAAASRGADSVDAVTAVSCQVAAYLLILFLILRVHAPLARIRDLLGFRATHAGFYPVAIALGAAIQVPLSWLGWLIAKRWPIEEERTLFKELLEGSLSQRVILALGIALAGPIVEEILFRGALLGPLRKRQPAAVSVVLVGALFAIAHQAWQHFLPLGVFGVALGVLRLGSGSLGPAIVLHVVFNSLPLALTLLDPAAAAKEEETPPLWAVAAATAISAGLIWLVHLLAKTDAARRAASEDAK